MGSNGAGWGYLVALRFQARLLGLRALHDPTTLLGGIMKQTFCGLVILRLFLFPVCMPMLAMQNFPIYLGADGASEIEELVRGWQIFGSSDHRFGRQYCGVCEKEHWASSTTETRTLAALVGGSVHAGCAARAAESLRGANNLLATLTVLSPQPADLVGACACAFVAAWARAHEQQSIADVLDRAGGEQEVQRFANGPGAQAMVDRVAMWVGGTFREQLLRRRFAQWYRLFIEESAVQEEPLGEFIEERSRKREVRDCREQDNDELCKRRRVFICEQRVPTCVVSSRCSKRIERDDVDGEHVLPQAKRLVLSVYKRLFDSQKAAELFRRVFEQSAVAEEFTQLPVTYAEGVVSDDVPVIHAKKRYRLAEVMPSL